LASPILVGQIWSGKDKVGVEQMRRNHGQTGVGGEYVIKEWWRERI
jgi:hypothetical protein